MCKRIFSLIMMLLFFQNGLLSMETSNFSAQHMPDFSQKMESGIKRKVTIYLAGKLPNGDEIPNDALHWTEHNMDCLRSSLSEFDVVLLNPAFKDCDPTGQDAVFGRDVYYVFSSDIIFVDARGARGLGVGAEMMWAKVNGIPVISWAPKNTYYNTSSSIVLGTYIPDFIHPFVDSLSDKIAENIEEGAAWIKQFMNSPHSVKIKTADSIHCIMEHYKSNQSQHREDEAALRGQKSN